MTKIVFPCDQETWWIVKDQLHYLKSLSEQENCDLTKLVECHQRIYNTNIGQIEQPDVPWGSSIYYGLVKYLRKHASDEEREHFLKDTFPSIIELALRVETLLPTEGIVISEQQKESSYSIPRQLCVSILACAFLCLFPNEQRGRGTKLNNINFNKFFSNLPIPSQNAKLRCVLNFFDRVSAEYDRLTSSIIFIRQVLKYDEIPSLDTWLDCSAELCPVTVHMTGVIEDAGSDTIEVDFANRYIGGGTLGRGRVQEEIRFTVCPELIVSMLFMEVMDDNEAIVIKGYEQFSATRGYAAGLQFVGDHRDDTEEDSDGNLKKTLCAIDAISYSHGRGGEQYTDHFILRDLNKAFTGFCVKFTALCPLPAEEEYYTAESSDDESDYIQSFSVVAYADNLVANAVEIALYEAVEKLTKRPSNSSSSQDTDTQDSSFSKSTASGASAGSTDKEIPMDHLEVNFRDWLAHYRRRSSNLSDLSSRRSSCDSRRSSYDSRRSSGCSTKYSSEFSSEFEEYYDNFQQQEKYKYHTIKEEVGPSAVNEFALNLAQSLLREGAEAFVSVKAEAGVKKFHDIQPSAVIAKPAPLKVQEVEIEMVKLVKGKSSDDISTDTENTENIEINETVARKFVDRMFTEIWPFQDHSKIKGWSDSQKELQTNIIILNMHENGFDKEGSAIDNLEDNESICSDSELTSLDDELEGDNNNENDNLIYIANDLVVKAFTEALIEYKQRYLYSGYRNINHSRNSSECSSIDDSDLGASGNDNLTVNISAANVADKVVSEMFDSIPDPGARPKVPQNNSSVIPLQAHCDINIVNRTSDIDSVTYSQDREEGAENVNKSNKIEIIPVEISYEVVNRLSQENNNNREADKFDNIVGSLMHREIDNVVKTRTVFDMETYNSSLMVSVSPTSQTTCDKQAENIEHNKENSSPRRRSTKGSLSRSPNNNSLTERSINICSSPKRDSINISPINNLSSNSSPRSAKSVSQKSRSSSSSQGKSKRSSKARDSYKRTSSPSEGYSDKKDYDQFANSLSRDLLTNVFLKVQDTGEEDMYSFPRRSSEPMQISNGAALQRLEHSAPTVNGKRAQKSKTDEDIGKFAEELSRHGASCDVGHRKSGSGFRDPVLSRFAEELMKANVSVPTFHVLNGCVSTSESSKSVCSTVSSFRDPVLASFEDELLNSSYGKSSARTHSSWSNRKGQLCHPRRESGNESSDNNYHSRYIGASFDSEFSAASWLSNPVNTAPEEVSDLADRLSRRILFEAVGTAFREGFQHNLNNSGKTCRPRRHKPSRCTNLNEYSNKLAASILRTAISEAENRKVCSDWLEQNKMVTWGKETECLEYSNDESETSDSEYLESDGHGSLTDRGADGTMSSLEYEDALDLPYQQLEAFAESLASHVMVTSVAVLKREQESQLRRQYGRPIATGNWGCGAFGGNPHLKSLIQWMAASYAGTPRLIYYTFQHEKMDKFQEVVDTVMTRGWTLAELMQAVRQYCMMARTQLQQTGEVSHDLFDVILHGEIYPGVS